MMSKTCAKLDDLMSRLLERESLMAIAALVVTVLEGWQKGGMTAGLAAFWVVARGYVKGNGK